MTTVTSRFIKGAPLTTAELDANLNNINNGKVEDTDARANTKPSLLLAFDKTKVLDPRITYTRASTATYYDGKTIAIAEQNLLLQSQNFAYAGGGTWGSANNNMVVTANTFTAPDGTNTASTLTASNTNSVLSQGFTATAVPYTFSVYLYRSTGTGNVSISVDGTTFVNQTISNTWSRYSTTLTPASGLKTVSIRLSVSGDSVYVWGAQLEQRSANTIYNTTTTNTIANTIPVLMTANNNVARFDHNPVTNESLGLLIEEQRTNLFSSSTSFSWNQSAGGGFLISNAAISPDGTNSATQFVENTAYGGRYQQANFSGTFASGSSYTYSLYTKSISYPTILIYIADYINGVSVNATFNTVTGSFVSQSGSGMTYTGNTITNIGDGWYRISLSVTLTVSTTGLFVQNWINGGAGYTGNGWNSTLLWGTQFEAGAFPTSYIPTTSGQVTRVADDAIITGTNFSSWFNMREGTLYGEAYCPRSMNYPTPIVNICRNPYITDTFIQVGVGYGASPPALIYNLGIYQTSTQTQTAITPGTIYKNAVAYTVGNANASVNGNIQSDLTISTSDFYNIGKLVIGRYVTSTAWYYNGWIKRIAYYPKRLSNTELQSITTL